MAFRVVPDDGHSPALRLDAVGRYPVSASTTPAAVMVALVKEPLDPGGTQAPTSIVPPPNFTIPSAACGAGEPTAVDAAGDGDSDEAAEDGAAGDGGEGGEEVLSTMAIGTEPVGGGYHAVGAALASLLSDHGQFRVSAHPYAGPVAWMPELPELSLELGVIATHNTSMAWNGDARLGFEEPTPDLRMVAFGNPLINIGLCVREDSEFQSLSDLEEPTSPPTTAATSSSTRSTKPSCSPSA